MWCGVFEAATHYGSKRFLAEVKYNVGSAKMRSFMFVITKLR
jgi:hypothetical protein